MNNKAILRTLLRCAALLLVTVGAVAEPAVAAEAPAEEQTPFQIISEVSKLDLTPYAGKAVFLNFFTEWCPYCMEEMADIKKVFETYSPDDLQIILVHVWDGEDEKNTASIRKDHKLEELTFFEDEDMELARLVGLQGYPASLFFDKEGDLAFGANYALSYDDMAKQMDSMDVAKSELAK
ncbi:MAG: TlpA disulfide reductase family protein [Clostridia bacterium]